MREGLKLADFFWAGIFEEPIFCTVGEEAALVYGGMNIESKLSGGLFNGGKVDVSSEVLLAGGIERVNIRAMIAIASQSAGAACGVVEGFFIEAVVDPEEEGFLKTLV